MSFCKVYHRRSNKGSHGSEGISANDIAGNILNLDLVGQHRHFNRFENNNDGDILLNKYPYKERRTPDNNNHFDKENNIIMINHLDERISSPQQQQLEQQPFISPDFLGNGLLALQFLRDYHNNIQNFSVRPGPEIKPGYMRALIPDHANEDPIAFENIITDVANIILPGIVHWQSPKFHGYFPAGFSEASVFADIISAAFSCIGFTWTACPAYTELEMIMVDWLAKEMKLPAKFLFDSKQGGGGVIQSSASEAVVVAFIAAREKKIMEILAKSPGETTYYDILSKLRAYTSDQAHSSVVKAARIAAITLTIIESESDLKLGSAKLIDRIARDHEQGLIPFFVCCTLGTTNTCAFDNINEIGKIAREYDLWFHIDAAYAGCLLLCEEYQNSFPGIEYSNSFTFNPHKMMNIIFDCSILWVDDGEIMKRALGIYPVYLKSESEIVEYKDWQIPLGRRFRSLKLYFHIKMSGMKQIKEQIRKVNIELAEYMGELLRKNEKFFIPYPIAAGMVCFYVKDSEEITGKLFRRLNEKDIYLSSTEVKGRLLIRFPVGCSKSSRENINDSFDLIETTFKEISSSI